MAAGFKVRTVIGRSYIAHMGSDPARTMNILVLPYFHTLPCDGSGLPVG